MLASVCPKLPMIDPAVTRQFYETGLGFGLVGDYGDYLMLEREGVELHFFSFPTIIPAKSDFMAYVRVEGDIDALHAEWRSQPDSEAWLRPLESKPWGMREFSVVDPNGTCLTFGLELG